MRTIWQVVLIAWAVALCPIVATSQPAPGPATRSTSGSRLLMAHYMPWFEAAPESNHWGWHWTMNHYHP